MDSATPHPPPPPRRARLAVMAAGQGTNLRALLAAIDAGRLAADVVLVVSHKAGAPVLELATSHGIPTAVRTLADVRAQGGTRDDLDAEVAGWIAAVQPDLVLCLGWMLILGPRFLAAFPRGRVLNLHPAPPGRFVGLDAIGQAWRAGQAGEATHTGVMIHEVIADLDAGTPLAWVKVPLLPDESLASLTARMHEAEHALVVSAVGHWWTTHA